MPPSCCSVGRVQAAYLVVLIATFVGIAAAAAFVVAKLFAGSR